MKKSFYILTFAACLSLTGCAVKYGCPSSGRNAGAEKLLEDDKKSVKKIMRKAGKFKGGKFAP